MRNNRITPLSFVNEHSPTNAELKEFMENVSSFDRKGRPRFNVMLNLQGNIIPTMEFMVINAGLADLSNRRINPSETLFIQPKHPFDWKKKTPEYRKYMKRVRNECEVEMLLEGKNPKKWVTYAKLLT